ncbi:MAG: FAD-binding oxidoreductase [Euryarchaeota archaeon]|nr:FAD-binding oxidoreductase [Euryarchaeota archaeon]
MIVRKSREAVADFLEDESHAFVAPAEGVEAIYYPETEENVISIMTEANERRGLVSVSGGGTGVTGARVPMLGGIVVSMESVLAARPSALEAIEYQGVAGRATVRLDRDKLVASVPPGISLQDLGKALPHDILYPPDPTETSALLGGTIATNASGARSFHYGATRRWVEGLRVVLGSGDLLVVKRGDVTADSKGILDFRVEGGKEYKIKIPTYKMPGVKHNAGLFAEPGMDLIDLFAGSEGILGIVTEATLRLERKPSRFLYDTAFFPDEGRALAFVGELRASKGYGVLSIEFFDSNSLTFLREALPDVKEGAKAAVFTEFASADASAMDSLSSALRMHGSIDDWCAYSERDAQGLKDVRHALPERVNSYLKERGSAKLGTDFAVPLQAFPEMMKIYTETGNRFKAMFPRKGVHHVLFGHAGDCHLHFNFIAETGEEMAAARKLYVDMARKAVSLGGTISAEHGLGKKCFDIDGRKAPYLELMYGMEGLEQIAAVKRALDPNLILNVGTVVPAEYLKKG